MTAPCTWCKVAPYRRSWGSWVSLIALKGGRKGITAEMSFPQWEQGVSRGRADPDSASSSCKHQVKQGWTGPAKMQGTKDPAQQQSDPHGFTKHSQPPAVC